MAGLLGEYEIRIDAKGRVKVPSALKRQFDPMTKGRFVINRGFEKCLVLYPYNEWERVSARVNKLNRFVKKNREFIRYFFRGATELTLDNADRINIPNHLLDYAGIKKELLLAANENLIEIWNKAQYDQLMVMESDEFADLAEEVMGDQSEETEE
jgi:transcriptional regulator MraZ